MDKSLVAKYVRPLCPIKTHLGAEGVLQHPVRAVLFDVYGTLFISAPGDSGSRKPEKSRRVHLRRLIDKYQLQLTPAALASDFQNAIEAHHRKLRAGGIEFPEVDVEHIWHQVLPAVRPGDIRAFAIEFEMITNPVYPMPGLESFLGACARQTARMGIISNAQFYTPYFFEWLLGADLNALGFDPELVVWSYRHRRAKPAPELFEHTARQLEQKGIGAPNVLFTGNDMLKDIYPARKCGFQTALFAGDKRSLRLRREDARCRHSRPDLIITELHQLLDHLKG